MARGRTVRRDRVAPTWTNPIVENPSWAPESAPRRRQAHHRNPDRERELTELSKTLHGDLAAYGPRENEARLPERRKVTGLPRWSVRVRPAPELRR